jgi:hypothetical protein
MVSDSRQTAKIDRGDRLGSFRTGRRNHAGLIILAFAVMPAPAQNPVVHLRNLTRPASSDFQVGDRFEIVITGAANQPVSVRTTMKGRTDWGPVIGRTDMSGRWSTAGTFEKGDFGDWGEAWTVGSKRADPVIRFQVSAPCLPHGQGIASGSGPNWVVTCETAEGRQTFATPSDTDPFRTPDGRVVPGRIPANLTREQYQTEILEYLITSSGSEVRSGALGDEAAALIAKMIGPNALGEGETRKVLAVIRTAFEAPEPSPEAQKDPSSTVLLLRSLADSTDRESLKQEIAETIAYVQGR